MSETNEASEPKTKDAMLTAINTGMNEAQDLADEIAQKCFPGKDKSVQAMAIWVLIMRLRDADEAVCDLTEQIIECGNPSRRAEGVLDKLITAMTLEKSNKKTEAQSAPQ